MSELPTKKPESVGVLREGSRKYELRLLTEEVTINCIYLFWFMRFLCKHRQKNATCHSFNLLSQTFGLFLSYFRVRLALESPTMER